MTSAYVRSRPANEDGGGDTDWSCYTLDQIWDMVKTEDGQVTHTQVDAWRRLAELCHEQADQLEKAVNQLLQRWPARPGSASEAFAHLVTRLIASMRQSAEAGEANQAPLRNIADALTYARFEIGALLDTRRGHALTEQQLTPQPIPSPGQIPAPAAPASLQPPPPHWRAQLDHQARTIMAHTDATVGTEAAHIQAPRLYGLRWIAETTTPLDPGVDGESTSIGVGGSTRPASAPPLAGSHVDLSNLGEAGRHQGLDPILSGGAVPGPQATDVSAGPGAMGGATSGGLTSGSFVTTPYGLVLAPGGTIGGRASTPGTPTSSRTPGGTAGGVSAAAGTGGAGAASRAGVQGAMPMAPMAPPRGGRPGAPGLSPAGRLGRAGRRNRRAHADPDDPWAVAEGGPAVLEPPPEPTEHDPGPGVIGLGR